MKSTHSLRERAVKTEITRSGELMAILSIAKYRIKIFIKYPFNLLYMLFIPIGFLFVVYVFGNLLDYTLFTQQAGGGVSISSYVYIGLGMLLLNNVSWNVGTAVQQERAAGVFENTMISPVPRFSYLIGIFLSEIVTTGLFSIFLILMGLSSTSLVGVSFVAAILSFVLSVASFAGLGFIIAALALRFRQISALTAILAFIIQFFAGVFIPVRALPIPIQLVSFLVPLTWSLDAFRSVTLNVAPLIPIWAEMVLLLLLSLAFVFFGYIAFKWGEKKMKEAGLIAAY